MTVRRIRGISVCLALACNWAVWASQHSFEHFSQEKGLSNSLVRALAQDKLGFLWIGTRGGLFRFDGQQFEHFGKEKGLPDINVRALHVAADGTLWIGTAGGVAKLVGNHITALPGKPIVVMTRHGIDSSADGRVFVSGDKGLYMVRSSGVEELHPPVENRGRGVFVDRDSSVWFGCMQAICRWDGVRYQVMDESLGVPAGKWSGYLRDGAGRLVARSDRMLLQWEEGQGRFVRDRGFDAPGSDQLILDKSGRLVAASHEGLWLREATVWTQISENEGLPASRINCVLRDQEGSVWTGFADFGVARWRGQGEWESYNRSSGLSHNEVTSIVRSGDGALWVGTRSGLNRLDPQTRKWRRFGKEQGLPEDDIRSLAVTPDGYLWVATLSLGLSRIQTKTLQVTPAIKLGSEKATSIIALYTDPAGMLWVAARGGLFRASAAQSGARFERMYAEMMEKGEEIYAVRHDRNGSLWLAGTRGLRGLVNGRWVHVAEKDGLRNRVLVMLTENRVDGSLWVGYGNYLGVSKIQWRDGKPTLEHFDRDTHLASNDMCFIAADARGWVWIGTDNGVDLRNGKAFRHIGSEDGLIWHDTVFNAFFEDKDGSVWIGTNRGLSHFRPDRLSFVAPQPAITLTSILFDGEEVDAAKSLEIPFDRNSLRVSFTSPAFSRRKQIQFRYRLKGLDSEWVETREPEAIFPQLAPGKYVFQVQAATAGIWNPKSAQLEFRILAPWWKSIWFATLLTCAVLGAGIYLYRRRMLSMDARQRELELAVSQRTHELREQTRRTEQEKGTVEAQKQEIEKLLMQAQEASRLKGEFLANVSHEIRTPMNGILGMTALALQTPLEPEQREYMETVRDSGEALLALLNDILDFSKIEANRLDLEMIPFCLGACLDECLKIMKVLADEKKLRLEFHRDPQIAAYLTGDPVRLRQILLNLLSNAIKFTDSGFVRLEVRPEETEGEEIILRFRVIDSGGGIPVEKQAVIFDAFRQVDGSTTRKYGGTGLGLSISSRLVAMMGGHIGVNSHVNCGSEFFFTARFGVAQAPADKECPEAHSMGLGNLAAAVAPARVRPLRILVAEDNVINQKLVVRMLEKQGHEVEVATDGQQAFLLTAHKHFDLILMDVQMPELDGLETTRLIREREQRSEGRMPIIMLTANAMLGDREKCLAAGADGYLAKPVSSEMLHTAIRNLSN